MRQIAWGLLAAGLISTTASAQEASPRGTLVNQIRSVARAMAPGALAPVAQAAAAPAPRKVTVIVGADMPFLTGYVFRGIVQEFDPAFTIQPYVDVGVAVNETTTVNIGTWNSFHTGSNKDALDGAFYESDLYASATFVAGKWKPGVLYTLYTSPAGGYDGVGDDGSIGVSELAFFANYDDSAMAVPMSPRIVLAFETTDTQADFGTAKGVYLELGVKPTFKAAEDSPVTFGVPVKLGLSLKDYYETLDADTGEPTDNKFGYLQFGVNASVPISAITTGAWEFHTGLDFFVFGENRKVLQEGDDEPKSFKPVFNIGFSATF
jgi:hypothetical protein